MSRNAVRDDARIGDFILSSEIGKGSFAVVHKGYRQSNREPVAIKIVTRKKLTAKLLDNLEGEIAILKAITHPNIVELKECLKTDAHIYLVMAFCSAGDLSQYIKKRYDIYALSEQQARAGASSGSSGNAVAKRTPSRYPHPEDGGLNETIVRSILTQLAGALEFMRGRDIVHRDIKPQNLLLQPPEQSFVDLGNPKEMPQVKVADFGFARHLGSNVLAETLCGSPLYMAPEILRYEKYDAKADLWSVGAVLFEMSVGKPPYKANNHVELLRRIEKGEDKIRFPDERSPGSLAREAARRQEAGEAPLPPPHLVSADIKRLIRQLLRQRPVERMSFEDFFHSPVIEDYKVEIKANVPLPAKQAEGTGRSEEIEAHTAAVGRAAQGRSASATGGAESSAADEYGLQRRTSQARDSPSRRSSMRDRDASGGRSDKEPAPDSPRPAAPAPLRSFTSRYVVGDAAAIAPHADPDIWRKSSILTASPPQPPSSNPPPRQPSGQSRASAATSVRTSSGDDATQQAQQRAGHGGRADGVSQFEDGKGGEDSFLGKEYVMVEKRNVEVNALADELAALPLQQQPAGATRRPSRLSRLSSGATAASEGPSGSAAEASAGRLGSTPPGGVWPSSAPFALPPGARPSSFTRRTSLSSSGSPSPRLTTQPMPTIDSHPGGNTTIVRRDSPSTSIPEEPSDTGVGSIGAAASSRPVYSASPSSSSPSSALARAISMASLRLFGVPSGMSLRGAAALVRSRSTRRGSYLRTASGEPAPVDAAEAGLLATLEDLGQKSFVLCEFGDSKLAAFYATGPHQPMQDLDSSSIQGASGTSPGQSAPSSRANRRTSSTSSISSHFDPSGAEMAAAEALVLYVKSLTFLQRGINMVKEFLNARTRPGSPAASPSAELNEIVQWLRARFNEGYDKATFARCRVGSSGEMPESAQHVDKLVFDKALEVARAAALDELENNQDGATWDPSHCLLAYETACSMLLALLDPGEEGMGLSDGSIATIEKFVKSIRKRLLVLQTRFGIGPGSGSDEAVSGGGGGSPAAQQQQQQTSVGGTAVSGSPLSALAGEAPRATTGARAIHVGGSRSEAGGGGRR